MGAPYIYDISHLRVKIYIKIDIKIAPTCFGVITIIRERTNRSC